ncbi:MAG: DUF4276 family protein [Anaerolineae bacterium]|nr:DUF4276 family protein [Anaerolineae bacterium]
MKFVHILVEGQTEEIFVQDVLAPYLVRKRVFVRPILATTKRVKVGTNFKGGIVTYGKVKDNLRRLLQDTNAVLITTMLDYYNLPDDFPRYSERLAGSCFDRVAFLEQAFAEDIANHKFLPYLALHEFEAMMFVSPDAIAHEFPNVASTEQLHAIRNAFTSPEEINENDPPSKRLLTVFGADYQKPFHGPLVTSQIGLDPIRQACAHFAVWVQQLEALGES